VDRKTLNACGTELAAVLAEVGLDDARVVPSRSGGGADGAGELLVMADGASFPVEVLARSDLRPVHARELADLDRHRTGMVFADRIALRTRQTLSEKGWGWLDRRRGHVRLWHTGLRIDSPVTPRVLPDDGPRAKNPFTPSGRQLALWLLMHPDEQASPRGIGRQLDISAGQVSNLLGALGAQALLRRDRRPLVPELFWALVEQWHPKRYPVVALPETVAGGDSELRVDEWVLTDAVAALALGAPLVVDAAHPPDLYVPDEATLSWILSRSELAPQYGHRGATVAVAPTPLVCDPSTSHVLDGFEWPVAHAVVVALDLATDRSRGRQVVEEWDPQVTPEVARVW
jgi:hypothetical protein